MFIIGNTFALKKEIIEAIIRGIIKNECNNKIEYYTIKVIVKCNNCYDEILFYYEQFSTREEDYEIILKALKG